MPSSKPGPAEPSGPSSGTIATILRHDRKVTTYKIALIRALNDVVLTYPDRDADAIAGRHIAVPLRLLAERWIAYYWPFVSPGNAILQGKPTVRGGVVRPDMSFRPALTELRREWERAIGGPEFGRPADGYALTSDLQLVRRRTMFPPSLIDAHVAAVAAIVDAIKQPIEYAGPAGEKYTVFDRPARAASLDGSGVVPLTGAKPTDYCVSIRPELWLSFRELSLYVEALCVHEWSLFTERLTRGAHVRGAIYTMITDRPDNRRPLSWERNEVDILMMEGRSFTCPWTRRTLARPEQYDLDHLVPVTVYPTNALWNLVPADPYFNKHVKGDRLPSEAVLREAEVRFADSYRNYGASAVLGTALAEDAAEYFDIPLQLDRQPAAIARATVGFIKRIADARNIARFG